jgi:hypothetical protein
MRGSFCTTIPARKGGCRPLVGRRRPMLIGTLGQSLLQPEPRDRRVVLVGRVTKDCYEMKRSSHVSGGVAALLGAMPWYLNTVPVHDPHTNIIVRTCWARFDVIASLSKSDVSEGAAVKVITGSALWPLSQPKWLLILKSGKEYVTPSL